MADLSDYVCVALDTPRGRIFLANLAYEAAHGHVPPEAGRALHDALLTCLEGPTPEDELLDAVEAVICGDWERFTLCCPFRTPADVPFSRVVDVESFARYNADPIFTEIDDSDAWADTVWDHAEALSVRAVVGGRFSSGVRIVWVTPAEDLDRVLADAELSADQAAAARDRLGLLHHGPEARLLRLDLPAGALEGIDGRAPTSLDALGYVAFMAAATEAGFGLARPLDGATGAAREAVFREFPVPSGIHVQRLGQPGREPPRDEDAWACERFGVCGWFPTWVPPEEILE